MPLLSSILHPACRQSLWRALALGCTTLALTACGGGSGSDSGSVDPGSSAVTGVVNASLGSTGTADFGLAYRRHSYEFHWSASPGATRYELYEDPDGAGPLPEMQIGDAMTGTAYIYGLTKAHERVNASYRLRVCQDDQCTYKAGTVTPDITRTFLFFEPGTDKIMGSWDSNTVALSADGKTLVIGAPQLQLVVPPSAPPVADNSAAYVFTRISPADPWFQQARLQANNNRTPLCTDNRGGRWCPSSDFGSAIALSADGNTLAVGAKGETSNARGVNGDASNTDALGAGAVYMFVRTDGAWSQQAYIKATTTPVRHNEWCAVYWATYPCGIQAFGQNLALSADGNLLAVTGANGTYSNVSDRPPEQNTPRAQAGAVYTYTRNATTWSHQAVLSASNSDGGDAFGSPLTLSGDGSTLAVTAKRESSNATGVNGNQQDNSEANAGAVYVFAQNNGTWNQQAYVKVSQRIDLTRASQFGLSTALSRDGNTLASSAAGAAFVYVRNGGTWRPQAHMTAAAGPEEGFSFAQVIALSGDGNTLLATRLNDNPIYLFTRDNSVWRQ